MLIPLGYFPSLKNSNKDIIPNQIPGFIIKVKAKSSALGAFDPSTSFA
jgi:hypothetical protein